MALVCSQCGVDMPPPQPPARINRRWNGMLMCSRECEHAAGSRSICGAWCGCTGYAIKRRLLREHRVQMRIMDSVIHYHDLEQEVSRLRKQQGSTSAGKQNVGKKGGGKGKGARNPHPLDGKLRTNVNGEPLCFNFSIKGCPNAKAGARCKNGWHLCAEPGCLKAHGMCDHS